MTRYLPIAVGVIAIFGLTAVQFRMTDRLHDTNVTAEQRAQLLNRVPERIGDWHGEEIPIDPTIQQTAGAVGAVSRTYRNVRTGESVDLWLIVGHARSVTGHTPDVCYPSSGFEKRNQENSLYTMVVSGQPDAPFFTNTFFKEDYTGRRLIRVFWAWHDSQSDGDRVEWEAPSNARIRYGNSRALYKMYFTSEMRDSAETAEQSPCIRFAQEFLPIVNRALSQVYGDEELADPADFELADPVAAPPGADESGLFAEPGYEFEPGLDEPEVPAAEAFDDFTPETELMDGLFDNTESAP